MLVYWIYTACKRFKGEFDMVLKPLIFMFGKLSLVYGLTLISWILPVTTGIVKRGLSNFSIVSISFCKLG